jgi:hypothetical protein
MKPRYVVLNERVRDDFEIKYQMPYGYGESEIFFDLEEAIDELEQYFNTSEFIIEEVTDGGRSTVYRGGLEKG